MNDVLLTVIGAAVTAFAGTGITVFISWLKNLKIVRKLGMEAAIDKAAEIAISYAESLGRKLGEKGTEKLNIARKAFEEELARQGIKLNAGDIERRLEAIFNLIKTKIEHKTETPS